MKNSEVSNKTFLKPKRIKKLINNRVREKMSLIPSQYQPIVSGLFCSKKSLLHDLINDPETEEQDLYHFFKIKTAIDTIKDHRKKQYPKPESIQQLLKKNLCEKLQDHTKRNKFSNKEFTQQEYKIFLKTNKILNKIAKQKRRIPKSVVNLMSKIC